MKEVRQIRLEQGKKSQKKKKTLPYSGRGQFVKLESKTAAARHFEEPCWKIRCCPRMSNRP